MYRKHESRLEARFFLSGTSPVRPAFIRAGFGQETKLSGLARHGLFNSKPGKPAFFTKPCLPARFFRVYRARPAFLDPQRATLGQEIEPVGFDGPTRFSNRTWQAGPRPGGPFGHLQGCN